MFDARGRLAQEHTVAYLGRMSTRSSQPGGIRERSRTRLSVGDWVAAGFRALVAGGPSALKVESLARSLGATKGSFYWHFADLADLRSRMITLWQRLGEAEITGAIRASGLKGSAALAALIDRISISPHENLGGAGAEPAIRAWALEDPVVAEAVARVDSARLEVLQIFFLEAGLPAERAKQSAEIFYASFLGLEALRLTTCVDMRASLEAQLAALISSPRDA